MAIDSHAPLNQYVTVPASPPRASAIRKRASDSWASWHTLVYRLLYSTSGQGYVQIIRSAAPQWLPIYITCIFASYSSSDPKLSQSKSAQYSTDKCQIESFRGHGQRVACNSTPSTVPSSA